MPRAARPAMLRVFVYVVLTRAQRLLFITCSTCGSHRTVQTIQTGFKAQVAKRRAQAAKLNRAWACIAPTLTPRSLSGSPSFSRFIDDAMYPSRITSESGYAHCERQTGQHDERTH